ncbi:hypothetical protein GC167_00865 [bacterium]|nr:hypothetical protein [bacterium]
MRDYNEIAEYWSFMGVDAYNTYFFGQEDWINDDVATNFLKKYSIMENEEHLIRDIQQSIFDLDNHLPEMIFKKNFQFFTLLGGSTFTPDDFDQFKSCLMKMKSSFFYVFQDTYKLDEKESRMALKMKFPVETSWN